MASRPESPFISLICRILGRPSHFYRPLPLLPGGARVLQNATPQGCLQASGSLNAGPLPTGTRELSSLLPASGDEGVPATYTPFRLTGSLRAPAGVLLPLVGLVRLERHRCPVPALGVFVCMGRSLVRIVRWDTGEDCPTARRWCSYSRGPPVVLSKRVWGCPAG